MGRKRDARTIDWAEVARAARRSKLGQMRPEDFDLVQSAFEADPERYSKVYAKAREEALAEYCAMWGGPAAPTPEDEGG